MICNIDQRLLDNSHIITETDTSHILLSKNSLVSWVIIVPKTNIIEWHELDLQYQHNLNAQINKIASLLKQKLASDKINIATIGNIVEQMHIHIIGRKKADPFWPDVVWGKNQFKEYAEQDLTNIKNMLIDTLTSKP